VENYVHQAAQHDESMRRGHLTTTDHRLILLVRGASLCRGGLMMKLDEWAWEIANAAYRASLFSQLTGRTPPRSVTDDEFNEVVRNHLTRASRADRQDMVELATAAALEVYDRIVARNMKQARAQPLN
jgi:hypothetical protein